jgi:hypothetical protein
VTLALHDDLYDAQFVRALAYTAQGGAEIGECFATAKRITKTDGELWYREWPATWSAPAEPISGRRTTTAPPASS